MRTYKYEIKPNKEQRQKLEHFFGCARFIFNWGLEVKIRKYKKQHKNVSCFALMKSVTKMKHTEKFKWLKDTQAQTLQMSLRNLDNAYTNFFKHNARFPKFKNKKSNQSISFPQNVSILDNGNIKLPKIGEVKMRYHRLHEGKIKTVTISKTKTGKYFACVLCDDGKALPKREPISKDTSVGIDLGLKVFAYTSDNKVFENQKYFIQSQKKLRKEQRSLSRKKKFGKNWYKQLQRVTKVHAKIANQRQDYLHKVSKQLVDEYDTICIEDLNVEGMTKNHKLAKHIQDAGWAMFRQFLEYKTEWYGKNLVVIGRFDASSKICNACGCIKQDLKLSDREWNCKECGSHNERDYNAAKNILDFGLGQKPLAVNVSQ